MKKSFICSPGLRFRRIFLCYNCILLALLVVLHRNDGDVTTPLGTHGRQIVRTGRGLHVCDWKLKMVIMNSVDAIIFVPEVIYAEIRDT